MRPAKCRPLARVPRAGEKSTLREVVLDVLARSSELELNVREDRDVLATRLADALRARPEAAFLRHLFANAPNGGTRIVVMREIGGFLEGHALDAAARLAGVEESER